MSTIFQPDQYSIQEIGGTDEALFFYLLHLADTSLITGHRNSEWTGHGPILEQDIALSNIALDQIGQSRNWYQYAATIKGGGATEDSLAYLRDTREYKNFLLAELTNGDWAKTITRQFFISCYQYFLFANLKNSADHVIAGISEKSLKEVSYHLRWSAEWVIRLGDGTEESHNRMNNAIADLWAYTGELFVPADYESKLAEKSIAINPMAFQQNWMDKVSAVLNEALLQVPPDLSMHSGGKQGYHTEHLGYILAEMQFLQRAYPGNEW